MLEATCYSLRLGTLHSKTGAIYRDFVISSLAQWHVQQPFFFAAFFAVFAAAFVSVFVGVVVFVGAGVVVVVVAGAYDVGKAIIDVDAANGAEYVVGAT